MSYQEQTTQDQTVASNVDERLATHDLFDTLKADASLSGFVEAMKGTQLESILHGPNLLTLLAVAGDAVTGDAADAVRNHILRGAYTEAELRRSPVIKTLDGKPLSISVEGGELRIGGVRVVRSDVECTNGVIHVVDTLMRG